MTRRGVLGRFLTTLQTTALGALTINLFTYYYRVVIVNQSKNQTVSAGSTDEFWKLNQDSFAEELNNQFMAEGRLLNVKSYLGKDGKSVVLVKLYRRKEDHLEYVRRLEEYYQSISYAQKTYSKSIYI